MDELDVLKLVASRLEGAGMRYMVTGSIAAALYALPRMTRDIDLVIAIGPAHAETFSSLFAADFLVDPELIATAVRDRGMFNLIHTEAVVKVDFIVRKDTAYRQAEFERRHLMKAAGQPIWAVSLEDLILSKLKWAQPTRSELQMRDVRVLLESGNTIDAAYIDHWAAELGIIDLWREVQPR